MQQRSSFLWSTLTASSLFAPRAHAREVVVAVAFRTVTIYNHGVPSHRLGLNVAALVSLCQHWKSKN